MEKDDLKALLTRANVAELLTELYRVCVSHETNGFGTNGQGTCNL